MFNEICINEEMLPIYIYIYIYILVLVCDQAVINDKFILSVIV